MSKKKQSTAFKKTTDDAAGKMAALSQEFDHLIQEGNRLHREARKLIDQAKATSVLENIIKHSN
ncbi:MAG: hypothetical protein AAB408_03790 [Patescibacteria group bacterium]